MAEVNGFDYIGVDLVEPCDGDDPLWMQEADARYLHWLERQLDAEARMDECGQ